MFQDDAETGLLVYLCRKWAGEYAITLVDGRWFAERIGTTARQKIEAESGEQLGVILMNDARERDVAAARRRDQ
jgi:hypothetical protein